MRESEQIICDHPDIMHETPCGNYWVGRDTRQGAYVVYKVGATHSTSDSGYALTPDGLSIAICRADYLSKRKAQGAIV